MYLKIHFFSIGISFLLQSIVLYNSKTLEIMSLRNRFLDELNIKLKGFEIKLDYEKGVLFGINTPAQIAFPTFVKSGVIEGLLAPKFLIQTLLFGPIQVLIGVFAIIVSFNLPRWMSEKDRNEYVSVLESQLLNFEECKTLNQVKHYLFNLLTDMCALNPQDVGSRIRWQNLNDKQFEDFFNLISNKS